MRWKQRTLTLLAFMVILGIVLILYAAFTLLSMPRIDPDDFEFYFFFLLPLGFGIKFICSGIVGVVFGWDQEKHLKGDDDIFGTIAVGALLGGGIIGGFIVLGIVSWMVNQKLKDLEMAKVIFGVGGKTEDLPKEIKEQVEESRNSVSLLGSSGSGKTVFFAMLSYVLGSGAYSKLHIEYNEGLGYLKSIRDSLEAGIWPAKTFTGTADRFSATIFEKKIIRTMAHRIVMNDIAGEDFERAFNPERQITSLPDELKHVPLSKAYIAVVDPGNVKEDSWRYYNLVNYLIKVNNLKPHEQIVQPVAIVFTKADDHAHILGDPHQFACSYLRDLYPLITRRIRFLRFFKVSAIGGKTSEGEPRLPLAPRGLAEVIEWVLNPRRTPSQAPQAAFAPAPMPHHHPVPGHDAVDQSPFVKKIERREPAAAPAPDPHSKNLDTYRAAVGQVLEDGIITMDEQKLLNVMQDNLGISHEEHARILKEEMDKREAPSPAEKP